MNAHELAANLIGVRTLEHRMLKNADGKTPQRFAVTSVKTWKRDRMRIHIGLKRGLYQNESIDSIDEFFQHFDIPGMPNPHVQSASVITR
jgi:hypothetical protein